MQRIEETLRGFFGKRPDVVLAYLFGSCATRSDGSFHDIDVAVLVAADQIERLERTNPYGLTAHLSAEVSHLLRYDPIDLVLLNYAPPLLLRQVIGKGKQIFCRSDLERIRFEVISLKRYADSAYLREIKRYYMNQRIEEGLAAYARS